MKRRILSMLLIMAMLIVMMPYAVFAVNSNTKEIVFDSNNEYRVGDDGLRAGEYRYTNAGKEYVFTIDEDLIKNDTLTLDLEHKKVAVFADLRSRYTEITSNYKHELPYEEAEQYDGDGNPYSVYHYYEGALTNRIGNSNNPLEFKINEAQRQHLDSSKTYYYTDPTDSSYLYVIKPEEDFGYVMEEGRTGFEEEKNLVHNGVLSIDTSDPNNPVGTLTGDYYTKHCYYIRSDSLSGNSVYLIVAHRPAKTSWTTNYNEQYRMIGYNKNDTGHADPDVYDREITGHASCKNGASEGQRVYEKTFNNKKPETFDAGTVLYNTAFQAQNVGNQQYYDGSDGSVENDPYLCNEFSTYARNSYHFWEWSRNQYALMAYDPATGYYTDKKVLGTVGATGGNSTNILQWLLSLFGDGAPLSQLIIHPTCQAESLFGRNHNHGDSWKYNGTVLKNDNASLASSLVGAFDDRFTFDHQDSAFELHSDNGIEGTVLGNPERYYTETYLYKMTFLYTKEPKEVGVDVQRVKNAAKDVDLIELRKATVKVDSEEPVDADQTFDIKIRLTDNANPDSVINGKYGDIVFTNNEAILTGRQKNDTVALRSLPSNYSIKVVPAQSDTDYHHEYSGTDTDSSGAYTDTASLANEDRNITITFKYREIAKVIDFNAKMILATEASFPNNSGTSINGTNGSFSLEGTDAVYQLNSGRLSESVSVINNGYTTADSALIKGKQVGEETVSTALVKAVPASNIYFDDKIVDKKYKAITNDEQHDDINGATSINASARNGIMYYTFTGTGIDIYCTTDLDGKYIQAGLFEGAYNGTLGKLVSGSSKLMKNYSATPRYNVPTLHWADLAYGTYTVKINTSSSEYKLDGIRIYGAVNESAAAASEIAEVYQSIGESNSKYVNLREMLINNTADYTVTSSLSADEEDILNEDMEAISSGVLFIDNAAKIVTTNKDENGDEVAIYKSQFNAYKGNGPKNEIYLSGGQGIIFTVNPSFVSSHNFWLGLSAPDNGNAECTINTKKYRVQSYVDMYYPIEIPADGVVAISNGNDSGLLSVTNLKVTDKEGTQVSPTAGMFSAVTGKTIKLAAKRMMLADTDPIDDEENVGQPGEEEITENDDPSTEPADQEIEDPNQDEENTPAVDSDPSAPSQNPPSNSNGFLIAIQNLVKSVTKTIQSLFGRLFGR